MSLCDRSLVDAVTQAAAVTGQPSLQGLRHPGCRRHAGRRCHRAAAVAGAASSWQPPACGRSPSHGNEDRVVDSLGVQAAHGLSVHLVDELFRQRLGGSTVGDEPAVAEHEDTV